MANREHVGAQGLRAPCGRHGAVEFAGEGGGIRERGAREEERQQVTSPSTSTPPKSGLYRGGAMKSRGVSNHREHVGAQGRHRLSNLLRLLSCFGLFLRYTGLAPWEFESSFPGSLISTFL